MENKTRKHKWEDLENSWKYQAYMKATKIFNRSLN